MESEFNKIILMKSQILLTIPFHVNTAFLLNQFRHKNPIVLLVMNLSLFFWDLELICTICDFVRDFYKIQSWLEK